jgi:resuscitation-promoting factor RpfB
LASEGAVGREVAWSVPSWLRGVLAVALLAGGLALLIAGWQRTGAPLLVIVDDETHHLRTHAVTVGDALRHAGVALLAEDWIWPDPETTLEGRQVIRIQRARPVLLHADEHSSLLRTHALTAGSLLASAGIVTAPADEIWLDGQRVNPAMVLSTASTTGAVPLISLRRAATLNLAEYTAAASPAPVQTTLHTTALTVGQALEEHGVELYLGDAVQPELQAQIVPGMAITIERSFPVDIQVDGRLIRTRTTAGSVAGVLGQEGVSLMGLDGVTPDLDAAPPQGSVIQVTRVREEYEVEFEPIPFSRISVPDPGLEIDQIRLVQEGQLGINKRRYCVVYEDNQEVDRFLEDAWAEQAPITRTVAYGTQIVIRTVDTPDGPMEYWRKIRVYTTSYRPASAGRPADHPRYGYTRLGWQLKKGVVAVDPTVIPLRSRLYVPGYGVALAGDTGGGVKGKFVDLGFEDSNYESWHWWTDVYLLTPVPPASQILWVLPDWPRFPDRRR